MIVEREPEYSDRDLARLELLAEIESETCGGCGYHPTQIPLDAVFAPEVITCPVCAGRERFDRLRSDELQQWHEHNKHAKPSAPRPQDGQAVWMRRMTPEEADAWREGQQRRAELEAEVARLERQEMGVARGDST